MKIVHLCESDVAGGAARAAFRLHTALTRAGTDSSMVVGRKVSGDARVRPVVSRVGKKIQERLDRLPRRLLRTTNETHMSPAWIGSRAPTLVNRLAPDLVHLHWIGKGFLRPEQIPQLRAPLVWSLHDMWAFSGAEHYVGACTRYRDGYRRDNRPSFERGFDLNRWVWQRKQRAWRGLADLTLFPVSEWLAARARESVLFRDRPIEVLHNAIDPVEFQPRDRADARRQLGLPAHIPLLLFGALDATRDRRKGFDLLLAALRELRGATLSFELVVFGNSVGAMRGDHAGLKTHYLGEISEAGQLAQVYSACDVVVVPSREEAFGQTALEALACGTPVVAFRVGGLPEVVVHGTSGYLATPADACDLAAGIHELLRAAGTDRGRQLAGAGRAQVEQRFTLEIQAARCRKLYAGILDRTAPAGAAVQALPDPALALP